MSWRQHGRTSIFYTRKIQTSHWYNVIGRQNCHCHCHCQKRYCSGLKLASQKMPIYSKACIYVTVTISVHPLSEYLWEFFKQYRKHITSLNSCKQFVFQPVLHASCSTVRRFSGLHCSIRFIASVRLDTVRYIQSLRPVYWMPNALKNIITPNRIVNAVPIVRIIDSKIYIERDISTRDMCLTW